MKHAVSVQAELILRVDQNESTSTHDLRFTIKQCKCRWLRRSAISFPRSSTKSLGVMSSSCPTSASVVGVKSGHQAFETDEVYWAGATHQNVLSPLSHEAARPLLHHHDRVNTLHKSIGQNTGRLAHLILADHVQNLVLERD